MAAKHANTIQLHAGDKLFSKGDETKSVYIVQVGEIVVFDSINGKRVDIGKVGKHQLIGEVAFLNQTPRSFSAEASVSSIVLELQLDQFEDYMLSQPDWMKILLKGLIGHVHSANQSIIELKTKLESLSPTK